MSHDHLKVPQGSLYPALHRLAACLGDATAKLANSRKKWYASAHPFSAHPFPGQIGDLYKRLPLS